MTKIILKLKRVKVKKYNSVNNSVDLEVTYLENDKMGTVEKKFALSDSAIIFAKNLLTELKKQTKVIHNLNFNVPLENFVNVFYDEEEAGFTEERLAVGLNRIKDKVREFKNIRSAENYMNRFHDLSNINIEFR